MSRTKPGKTVKGHVLVTVGFQRFLVSSKSKALAIIDALIDAPEVKWEYHGENRYRIGPPAECKMELTGTLKFMAAAPTKETPAPKAEAPKPASAKPEPAKPEPEPQMVDPRPVSKKTARAQLALIANSLEAAPASEQPQLGNGQFELVPEHMRLGNGNVIALPDRARGAQQDDLFRLEAGGGR